MDGYKNATLAILVGNFVLFGISTWYFGGDAINGKAVDGHYFLANHGRLTEVSHGVFVYSEIHTILFFVISFAVLVLAIVWEVTKK